MGKVLTFLEDGCRVIAKGEDYLMPNLITDVVSVIKTLGIKKKVKFIGHD